jgi:hypothetical protein
MMASELATRLNARKTGLSRWTSKCPAHPDDAPSLSLSEGQNGRTLLKCHAGCNLEAILNALNLTVADISKPSTAIPQKQAQIVAYDYCDAAGKLLFQAVRYVNPKRFRQRRPDQQGGWVWDMKEVTRVPFNLPAVMRSNVILIAEGEKDALNLQDAAAQFPGEDGKAVYAATTNIGGAGKWLDEYSRYLAGKDVFVFPDYDEPGRKHAEQVCTSASKYARAVHLVELPNLEEHGDVSDYLKSHSPAELLALMKTSPAWTPSIPELPLSLPSEDLASATAELLEMCREWIQRYIVVSDEQAVILAAWTLHTYVFDAAETTPYIHISAPERECGKSRLMETLEAIAAAPIRSGGMTAAALVRTIEAKRPTIFLDEMDALLGGDREYVEAIRGILNEGFRKGGIFYKCVGKDFDLKGFNVYCPKCFAGIGQLPDTVSSRSIIIEMRRKLPGESVEPFRQKAVRKQALPIKTELEAWAGRGAANVLQTLEPASINGLSDRQNDIVEPLLCIAQLAGDEWLQRITTALRAVFRNTSENDSSIGSTLLSDIRTVFSEGETGSISSNDLADGLRKIEGRPWAVWSHGKGLTAHTLARQLGKFKVHPQKIRFGTETAQGYHRRDFEDVWSRYCPLPPTQTGTVEQTASSFAGTTFSNQNARPPVPVAENASDPHEQWGVPDVPLQNRGSVDSEMRT